MKTFTFTDQTSHQLLQDLNAGRTVKLAKENGSAVILRDGIDIDEFGDNIYRMTIQPAQGEPIVKHVPMNATDMFHFLMYEKFTQYEITNN